MREFAGGMERSIRRNPKLQAPNYKQISNSNIGPPDSPPCGRVPSFNDQNRFGILNFDHCDLFVICYLLFGIFCHPSTPILQVPRYLLKRLAPCLSKASFIFTLHGRAYISYCSRWRLSSAFTVIRACRFVSNSSSRWRSSS